MSKDFTFMKRILRREILIEKEKLVFLRKKSSVEYPMCETCEEELMLPPDLIAEFLQISLREIYRRIESDKKIHFVENPSFHLFVCLSSLAKSIKHNKKITI